MLAADHVLYQSAFSKLSADRFLGEPRGGWEILPNAVDVERFAPAPKPPTDGPVLLLGGDQTQAYRLELALRTLRALHAQHPEARLLVTGRLVSDPAPLVAELGLEASVELLGEYDQRDAPSVLRRAHVLLHTKMQDPCPTLVLEAMACGLPVAYAASGGTVELVGDAAGVGVPHPATWDREAPPEPGAMAAAVDRMLGDLPGTPRPRGRAPSSGSRSPTGSTATWRCSTACCRRTSGARRSRARGRAASPRGTWRDPGRRAAVRAPIPPSGRRSMRTTVRGPYR